MRNNMKKLILIFIALSFFSVCFAGSIQDMHKAAIARKNATISYLHSDTWEGSTDAEDNWDSFVGTDAHLEVDTDDGVDGSDCMVWDAEVGTQAYVVKTLDSLESEIYCEICFKYSDGAGWGVSDGLSTMYLYDTGSSNLLAYLTMNAYSGVMWNFRYYYLHDAGTSYVEDEFQAASDTYYCVKYHYKRATGASTNDGVFQAWRDDVIKVNLTNVDNYNVTGIQVVKLGLMYVGINNAGDYIYFDNWWIDNEDH